MDELVRWLGEQLDEDERIARAAGGRWRELSGNWVAAVDEPASAERHRVAMVLVADERAHIVRHDPARVLREINAKRAIVRDLAEVIEASQDYKGPDYYEGMDACERTLKRLALPYADRPGYRDGWRP